MKLTLERKIGLGFGAAAGVLFLVTCAALWNVARFQGTHYWVEHSRDVLSGLERALSDVLGMQSSARGFVLTGSDEVLQPFEEGSADLNLTLTGLRELVADNPAQTERLARVIPLAERARELMNGRIAGRRARGLDAASETSSYLEGQRTVEAFQRGIRDMAAAERQLLDDRLTRNKQAAQFTVFTIAGVTVAALALVALATVLVRRDLARRRAAEVSLQQTLARVQDLYDNAPCGYHSLDAVGLIVAINNTALGWLGYDRSEVVGRMNFADILTPESAADFADRYPSFMKQGAVQNAEYVWRRKDGSVLPVLLNATAIYDSSGRYVASRATVFDVSERKRAEDERDRFFTVSRDLLSISTFEGYFKRVNPAWEEALGYSSTELLARPQLEFVHPADRAATQAEMQRLAAGGESVGFENRFQSTNGRYHWLRWNMRASPAEGLVFASARDVTETKAAEDRIQGLNADLAFRAQQLEAANHELESFSYSVSHDLRAPLRHIDGFANLLTKRAAQVLDDEARRYVAIISKSARQMGMLIDDLIAFSRIGRTPLQLEPVNQNELVAAVIADARYDFGSRKATWDIGDLPEVRGDASMLRQVWSNLLDNAVKYSGKVPAPHFSVRGRLDEAAGEYVFSVGDNGVGFDMAYADKLFGVFQRLHGPTEFEGTGIGLANVRRVIARHGGRTWAEGRVGEGATFYFSLPLTPVPVPLPD